MFAAACALHLKVNHYQSALVYHKVCTHGYILEIRANLPPLFRYVLRAVTNFKFHRLAGMTLATQAEWAISEQFTGYTRLPGHTQLADNHSQLTDMASHFCTVLACSAK